MPDLNDILAILTNPDIAVPLGFSLLTGAVIGGEREIQGKPAGLRTHMLVCLASTLLMLIAVRQSEWSLSQIEGTQIVADLTRMPHGILTGIGFLGAGVIQRDGVSVHGLTTAASLWVTAALGIVYGVGLVELGIIGSVTTFGVLVVLRLVQYAIPARNPVRISVSVRDGAAFGATELQALLSGHGVAVRGVSWRHSAATGLTEIGVAGSWRAGRTTLQRVVDALRGTDGIVEFSVRPPEGPGPDDA